MKTWISEHIKIAALGGISIIVLVALLVAFEFTWLAVIPTVLVFVGIDRYADRKN